MARFIRKVSHGFAHEAWVIRLLRAGSAPRLPADCPRAILSGIMSGMASVTVRELQKDLKRVLARVARGQSLQVLRHRVPVAVLTPARPEASEPWPDLDARARAVFGIRVVSPSPSEHLARDRGDW